MTTLESVAQALDVPPARVADIVTVVLFHRVSVEQLEDWATITDQDKQSLYLSALNRLRQRLTTQSGRA